MLKDAKFYGSPEEVAKTGSNPADVKGTADSFDISPRAISNFKFHHGGTEEEAIIQIRWMLADFLDKSGRTVTTANYLALSREGYRLHVGPARNQVTSYSTTHRERTWEQIKLGIPSRIGLIDAEAIPILPSLQPQEPEQAAPRKPTPITLAVIKAPVVKSGHLISEDVSSPAVETACPQTVAHAPDPGEASGAEVNAGVEPCASPIMAADQHIAPTTPEPTLSEADPVSRKGERIANRSAESVFALPTSESDTQSRPTNDLLHLRSVAPTRNVRLIAFMASTITAIWLTEKYARTKGLARPRIDRPASTRKRSA